MANYILTERSVRALKRNEQARRVAQVSPTACRSAVIPPNMHTMRMECEIGTVIDPTGIKAAFADANGDKHMGKGRMRVEVPQADGTIIPTAIVHEVFNPFGRIQPFLQFVHILRDWRTGRWIIVGGVPERGEVVSFKLLADLGFGTPYQTASLIKAWLPDNRLMTEPYSSNQTIYVYNPPLASGGYLFAGASGNSGIATGPIEGDPNGYVIQNMQCPV